MSKNRPFQAAILALMGAMLLLAGCTRAATTDTLPTTSPEGVGGGGEGVTGDPVVTQTFVANMQATLSSGQTQTAQAGGGQIPGVATSTPTPPVIVLVTNTVPPPPATSTPVPTGPRSYTVKSGDWLYKIARENGVSYQAILAANPGINPNFLIPGQVITIPGSGTGGGGETPGAKTYVVKPGDNLFRIGLNNGTTYQQLAALNNIPAPYTVYPGQVLKLP